ncbi:hypothetical protein DO72_5478 [Burkholderia pseudomallei]|nr:hypothetical protein DO72_5478 [Burkholderia pseudomallei]
MRGIKYFERGMLPKAERFSGFWGISTSHCFYYI